MLITNTNRMTGGTALKLARLAAEEYIRHQSYAPLPTSLPAELLRQQACYVTIFENPGRHLRSQYGQPLPRHATLAEEIVMNTVEAIRASTTHGFRPIDLPDLVYTIAVIGSLERISQPEHLDPLRYGLYLRSDRNHTIVILPQRAGIATADDQIATAFRESGIDPKQEATTLYRFAVTTYED